jgi:hypothetical protein
MLSQADRGTIALEPLKPIETSAIMLAIFVKRTSNV